MKILRYRKSGEPWDVTPAEWNRAANLVNGLWRAVAGAGMRIVKSDANWRIELNNTQFPSLPGYPWPGGSGNPPASGNRWPDPDPNWNDPGNQGTYYEAAIHAQHHRYKYAPLTGDDTGKRWLNYELVSGYVREYYEYNRFVNEFDLSRTKDIGVPGTETLTELQTESAFILDALAKLEGRGPNSIATFLDVTLQKAGWYYPDNSTTFTSEDGYSVYTRDNPATGDTDNTGAGDMGVTGAAFHFRKHAQGSNRVEGIGDGEVIFLERLIQQRGFVDLTSSYTSAAVKLWKYSVPAGTWRVQPTANRLPSNCTLIGTEERDSYNKVVTIEPPTSEGFIIVETTINAAPFGAEPTPLPAAPIITNTTQGAAGAVTITFKADEPWVSFKIYRNTSNTITGATVIADGLEQDDPPAGGSELINGTVHGTYQWTYDDSSGTAGVHYFYFIKAYYGSNGEGAVNTLKAGASNEGWYT